MYRITYRIYGNAPKRLLIIVSAFVLLLTANKVMAQECVKFYQTYCISYEEHGYRPMQQSRNFKLAKGDFAQQELHLNNGQDYHISLAVDDVFAQQLFLQIIDTSSEDVLYDNTKDDMNLDLEFSAIKDVKAKIYIETHAPVIRDTLHEINGCIGLLIETRPTPPTGFLK